MTKTYLSRNDEMVLLAILRLRETAYLVSVRDLLNRTTKKKWTMGNLFVALEKLEAAGYISSRTGRPSAKRGGKAIKFYKVTKAGLSALKVVKSVQDDLWNGLDELVFTK